MNHPDADLQGVRALEAALTRLCDQIADKRPDIATALRQEIRLLQDLTEQAQPPQPALQGGLARLRDIYNAVVIAGLYNEAKDASVLILLNRLLGV